MNVLPLDNLRRMVGITSVGKMLDEVGVEHNNPTAFHLDDLDSDLKGTSAESKRTGDFTHQRMMMDRRRLEDLRTPQPATRSVSEALKQLETAYQSDPTAEARKLVADLATQIDEEGLLREFSAIHVAAVCLKIGNCVFERQFVLKDEVAFQDLHMEVDAIRIAYNHMWLDRHKLKVLLDYGDWMECLPSPIDKYGERHMEFIWKDQKIDSPPESPRLPRKASFVKMRTLMPLVSYPPTTPDDDDESDMKVSLNSFDEPTAVSATSKEDWEDWSSDSSMDIDTEDESDGEELRLGIDRIC